MKEATKFTCPKCGETIFRSTLEDLVFYTCINPSCEGTFNLEELQEYADGFQ